MNPTEIADALDMIAQARFDPATFAFAFAEATDNAQATISKLRAGTINKSDLADGVLLNKKFHYAPAAIGEAVAVLEVLRASKKTASAKPAILLATDGQMIAAEHPRSGETLHCAFGELGKQFAFFLPAAGKERYQAAQENPVDVKATGKLAKLYDALIKVNPDWAGTDRRHAMNLFMTRLIFCMFAEDVGVFAEDQFSRAVFSYSGSKGEHAQQIIAQAFQVMNTPREDRAGLAEWAQGFDYVNGGLFAGENAVPTFDPIAFRYLRDACDLDWKLINPDIFGSMIQSVADPETRAELGMHYTSVPNIMKVLGPLFLDDLDAAITKAWDSAAGLRVVLDRLERIAVFDPACGSGNFLVVAYRELRERELRLLVRLNTLEANPQNELLSRIKLSRFYGIELTDFAAETAKLALFIAEYQANARFHDVFGRMPSLLPLQAGGKITCGNALRLDWEEICPPPKDGEEVYIAGNPPFLGSTYQSKEQKADLAFIFAKDVQSFAAFDFVAAWFFKASQYIRGRAARSALVSTNSLCQGYSVAALWPYVLGADLEIAFAHRNFKWRNNAAANAAVICSIIGLRNQSPLPKRLFDDGVEYQAQNINAYLIDGPTVYVETESKSLFGLPFMDYGNKPADGGHLILAQSERDALLSKYPEADRFVKKYMGSQEVVRGQIRYCLWVKENEWEEASCCPALKLRFDAVADFRRKSSKIPTQKMAQRPFEFDQIRIDPMSHSILVPSVTSEQRPYLPVVRVGADVISSNANQVLYDAPEWCIALIASRLHLVWIATVCGKLKSDFRYSNTLGWNTFPVPKFTAEQLEQLGTSARRILKTRYQHYPKTIADLYDPDKMPDDLRQVHRENDDLLESMYMGRPFRNDSERLERLFKLYSARIAQIPPTAKGSKKGR